jgi:hypothetical protein
MQMFEKSRRIFRRLRQQLSKWPDADRYLQTARTLDEAYYPSLDETVLRDRNKNQVVTRECRQLLDGSDVSEKSKPLLMVSQFWIWRWSKLVVSAYSPPGKIPTKLAEYQPPPGRHPYDWMDADIGMPAEFPHEGCLEGLVACLIAAQIARFGAVQADQKYQPPLAYFENGVVRVHAAVSEYTKSGSLEVAVDADKEAGFMRDIADIKEELTMIGKVLRQQHEVLDHLIPLSGCKCERDSFQLSPIDILKNAQAQIKGYRDRVARIERDSERIDKVIGELLNLKRTAASIRDAAASGKDARTSLVLGIAVIGFTVITIIFAPLAFMAALFALNIDGLAKHKSGEGNDAVYPGGYVAWTFGEQSPCYTHAS